MTGSGAPEVLPAATRRPQTQTPARPSGSIRRSSHIGVQLPGHSSELRVHGAVRDVITSDAGEGRADGEATLDCVVAADRSVISIVTQPDAPSLQALIGRVAHRGWRAAARELVDEGSQLLSLLDDVPIALLLSSYGALRQGALDLKAVQPLMAGMRNLCAGWAEGATPMRTMDAGQLMPLPGVVPVPPVSEADTLASEPREPLVPQEVRRVRRIDVVPGETVRVQADFRDSYCDGAGEIGVLHEYVVNATLTPDGTITSIQAEPRVLPYDECSFAATSPQRLVGLRIEDVAEEVRARAGTATCSHLDDLLRSLSAVSALQHRATAPRAGW